MPAGTRAARPLTGTGAPCLVRAAGGRRLARTGGQRRTADLPGGARRDVAGARSCRGTGVPDLDRGHRLTRTDENHEAKEWRDAGDGRRIVQVRTRGGAAVLRAPWL